MLEQSSPTPGVSLAGSGQSIGAQLVRWPDEQERLDRLRRSATPRLLVVAADGPPPVSTDCEEDWVRWPADDAELRSRAEGVAARAGRHLRPPAVDGDGVLHFGGRWAALSPLEEALARALAERFGDVVAYDELSRRCWPDDATGARDVRAPVMTLRRRLAGLGLEVHNVRGNGYVLDAAENRQPVGGEGGDRAGGVVVVWLSDVEARERLARQGTPRLVLVGAHEEPPVCTGCDEDWLRLPARDDDMSARVAGLTARGARHAGPPDVGAGRLSYRGAWVPLSLTEERLASALVKSFGEVVDVSTLLEAGWPHSTATETALRVQITRLRRRLFRLGLVVVSVHNRGYVLQTG